MHTSSTTTTRGFNNNRQSDFISNGNILCLIGTKSAIRTRNTVCIGPHSSKDSYLNIPALIAAAEVTHADAIHPGYGFLSESADFAQQVEEPSSLQVRKIRSAISPRLAIKTLLILFIL
jgi:hypothetical protein